MDPDANLEEQLRLTRKLLKCADGAEDGATLRLDSNDAMRLCELVEALDTWIRKGGHPPQAWHST